MPKKRPAGRTKILANKHTGKLQPHKHTSYGSLLLILVLACCCVVIANHTVSADDSGSYQTYAVVPAPIYKSPPSITNIHSGQIFRTADPVTVTGSCPGSSLVEIFKNDVMAGAALCHGGSYQLAINLFAGSNAVFARAYNVNNAASPDSAPISVRLLSVSSLLATTGNPFYLSAEQTYRAAKTGEVLTWPLTISGGQPPYAVSVNWGDGRTDLFSRTAPGSYNLSHSYKNASPQGNYTVVVRGTDQSGANAYLQLVALVRGPVAAATTTQTTSGHSSLTTTMTRLTWVVLVASGLSISAFWLGERREAGILMQRWGKA